MFPIIAFIVVLLIVWLILFAYLGVNPFNPPQNAEPSLDRPSLDKPSLDKPEEIMAEMIVDQQTEQKLESKVILAENDSIRKQLAAKRWIFLDV